MCAVKLLNFEHIMVFILHYYRFLIDYIFSYINNFQFAISVIKREKTKQNTYNKQRYRYVFALY